MNPIDLAAPLVRLHEQPWRFAFFQAMRLLQRSGSPGHCASQPGLAFAPSDLASLEREPSGAWCLRVNFLGLCGPNGVLPRHYSEWQLALERRNEHAFSDFLDLFNQRLLDLFWRAWAHHRSEVGVELDLGPGALGHVYDLIGLGTPLLRPEARARTGLPGAALGYYSGLIAQRPHGPGAVAQIMSHWLQAQVTIQPCVGTWQRIPPTRCTRLGKTAARLANDCQLGSHYWDRQSTLRLVVGPLSQVAFEALLPCAAGQGARLSSAVELARFITGLAIDLRICLVLALDQVPKLRLGQATHLGWNTWLGGQPGGAPRAGAAQCEFRFNATGEQSWR
ncbi:type VI secretion system baseplate subunit TssG [Pseudomonas putida]